jgi:hypothetical protein
MKNVSPLVEYFFSAIFISAKFLEHAAKTFFPHFFHSFSNATLLNSAQISRMSLFPSASRFFPLSRSPAISYIHIYKQYILKPAAVNSASAIKLMHANIVLIVFPWVSTANFTPSLRVFPVHVSALIHGKRWREWETWREMKAPLCVLSLIFFCKNANLFRELLLS